MIPSFEGMRLRFSTSARISVYNEAWEVIIKIVLIFDLKTLIFAYVEHYRKGFAG